MFKFKKFEILILIINLKYLNRLKETCYIRNKFKLRHYMYQTCQKRSGHQQLILLEIQFIKDKDVKILVEMLLDATKEILEPMEDMDGEVHLMEAQVGVAGEDKAGEVKAGEANGVVKDNKDLDHLSIIPKALISQINITKLHKNMNL